jgi:uncharacterized membrane protein (UPF0127 family)
MLNRRRLASMAAGLLTSSCAARALSQGGDDPESEQPVAEWPSAPTPEVAAPQAVFGSVTVAMEVARTDTERQRGLGGHAPLGETDGMLFVFERPSFHAFWMKGMLFPLDLMWIENGQVVYVERNAPNYPPETSDRVLPIYAPPALATYVLEVNAGFADRYGIGEGAFVELRGV